MKLNYQQTNFFFEEPERGKLSAVFWSWFLLDYSINICRVFSLVGCLWSLLLTLRIYIFKRILIFLGTREERAVSSLLKMGPAIVNGGITTFLALLLLGFSQSHVFITFFKVLIELVIQFFQSLEKKAVILNHYC